MTRCYTEDAMVEVWEDDIRIGELPHLRHKSDVLDWTRGTGPGAGNAPSDLARSIVGDLTEDSDPAPALYREVTLQLASIPHEGGELTADDIFRFMLGGRVSCSCT